MQTRQVCTPNAEKVRAPIVFFCVYLALILFQPPGTGTLLAFVSMALLLISCLFSKAMNLKEFTVPFECGLLFLFFVLSSVGAITSSYGLPSSYYKYAGQIILCIILFNININQKEHHIIKWTFICSTGVYAIEALRFCISNEATRFYHGDIVLFGASFDPNFIGISFVIASVFLLNNILRNEHRWISVLLLFLVYAAIIYSASRGGFISLIAGNGLVFLVYLKDRKINFLKRLIMMIVIICIGMVAIGYFSENMTEQWDRISQVGEYEDNGRFQLWENSYALISRSPFFGNGMQSMYNVYSKASHNTYLQLLVEDGALGFALFFVFLFRMLRKAFRYDRVYFYAMLAMLVQIFFLDALDNRCVWGMLCWIAMMPDIRKDKCRSENVVSKNTAPY